MKIGERIKNLRVSNKLTQEELGNLIEVNKATINRYETNVLDIKRTIAIKLAKALNCSPAYIMGWEDINGNSTFGNNMQPTIKQKELTSDEEKLLTNYNKLNADGKDKVQDYTKDLTGNKIYTDKLQDKLHA